MNRNDHLLKGSALVVTLAFLVLITVLVVGMMGTVQMESVSSHSNLDAVQADLFAQSAVERVVGTLREQTSGMDSATNYNWISRPGQLLVASATSNGLPDQVVPLSSGSADLALSGILYPPNLNIPSFRDPSTHVITEQTGTAGALSIAWIYVRKSGLLDTDTRPDVTNKADPIVGRYAYWTDDESCKINCNLARGRVGNTTSMSDPSQTELAALPLLSGTNAYKVNQFITQTVGGLPAHGFYNTPDDVLQAPDDQLAAALNNYRSEMTHYNSAPAINLFGERRIALTTKRANMPSTSGTYLRIFNDESKDPEDLSNINDAYMTQTINLLTGTMGIGRTDWPMAQGSSFQNKYYSSDPSRAAQIALNIIEYVRSRESVGNSNGHVMRPIRGSFINQTWASVKPNEAATADSYFGVTRAPCITELGVSQTSGTLVVKVELFSPAQFNLGNIDLTKYRLWVKAIWSDSKNHTNSLTDDYQIPAQELSQTQLMSGRYVTITHAMSAGTTFKGCSVRLRVALSLAAGTDRVDIVPLTNTYITAIVDGASMETNDPRINKNTADWKENVDGGHTFGARNSRYLGLETTSISPPQDTDGKGALSDASLYMPPPGGVVNSVGELGYIHTGGQSPSKPGIPWRTLRLQPNSGTPSTLPDWALLDLFSTPVTTASNAVSRPHGTAYGGRVNVNAFSVPFDFQRVLPLAAVFQGSVYDVGSTATLSSDAAQSIARNIYNRTATSGTLYNFQSGYYSPGEIVEIDGVADRGEQSEELVRRTVELLSVRSNVFTVYSIGQSIKQTPSRDLRVTGERRLQSMVERYIDPAGVVRFKKLFYKNLTP